jgi:hypothetical protein
MKKQKSLTAQAEKTLTQAVPRSSRFKDARIFTEHYVKMRGNDYYMRVFYDGSSEFVRYDAQAGKWVFLCFSAA